MTDGALKTRGIHHITAFAGSAQANLDFYAGVLGLRLVKKTVNFDAPHVYHFYYGDERGTPGTVMTFFPFEDGRQGRVGGGQVGRIRFAAPPGSLPFWEDRLSRYGVEHERIRRFGGEAIRFRDHEGLQLELEEQAAGKPSRWSFAGFPADKAIKGFAGALLYSIAPARTMQLLERLFGFVRIGEEGGVVRSEEHMSELQSRENLVCRLLLEKKKHKHNAGYLRRMTLDKLLYRVRAEPPQHDACSSAFDDSRLKRYGQPPRPCVHSPYPLPLG